VTVSVVDTKVPLVANGVSGAGPDCVIACVDAIRDVVGSGHLVVDDAWLIVGEYQKKLRSSGQPGLGDAFLKWVLTNLWNAERCTQVRITPVTGDPTDFSEFPEALRSVGFDRDDRKFVAVAVAHGGAPTILQAADGKWWGLRNDLDSAGLSVKFLCEEEIARKHADKAGAS